jgi:hypothetical protein
MDANRQARFNRSALALSCFRGGQEIRFRRRHRANRPVLTKLMH